MNRVSGLLAIPVILSVIIPGCGYENWRGGYGGHMMNFGYGGGFMWILLLVVLGVLIYFLLQASKSKGSDRSVTETPLDILKKRYAKGEITKEEFDRIKADIER